MNDTTRPAGPWADDDLVPLSALQHWAYCPRQCALIHVERVWDENVFTLRGRRAHERVDRAEHRTRGAVRTEYALPLLSRRHGLVGRADAVELPAGGPPRPVEHKVGQASRWGGPANRLQLCAQALCLEEMFGADVPEGDLFYGATKRRTVVAFDAALRAATLDAARAVRQLMATAALPAPVADARCPRCSLVETCMPGVVARLGVETEEDGS